MNSSDQRASHRTVLTISGGGTTYIVREDLEEVMDRIATTLRDGKGWFVVTAAPEDEPIWINAALLSVVGRERTPIEVMHAEGSV